MTDPGDAGGLVEGIVQDVPVIWHAAFNGPQVAIDANRNLVEADAGVDPLEVTGAMNINPPGMLVQEELETL